MSIFNDLFNIFTGTNVGVPEVTMRPETMPPNVPCTGQFDTITRTADGSTYAFKDNLVFKLDSDSIGLEPGFPAEISSVFPGLPNNLDASVFWDDVSKTYFFKVIFLNFLLQYCKLHLL